MINPIKGVNPGDLITSELFNTMNSNIKELDDRTATEGWKDASLNSNWKDYNESKHKRTRYFRDSNGIVHLQGAVSPSSGENASNTIIFTLEERYKPENDEVHLIVVERYNTEDVDSFNYDSDYCKISNNGEVSCVTKCTIYDVLLLDGITFKTTNTK